MTKPTFVPVKREKSADLLRVLSTVILLMIAVLVIFHAVPFWLIPAKAAAIALFTAQVVSTGALAAFAVHVSAGVWALILSIALMGEVCVTRKRTAIQFSLYLLLTCALGVFFAAASLVEKGMFSEIGLHLLFSLPGGLALGLGFVSAIMATEIPQLYEQSTTSVN